MDLKFRNWLRDRVGICAQGMRDEIRVDLDDFLFAGLEVVRQLTKK